MSATVTEIGTFESSGSVTTGSITASSIGASIGDLVFIALALFGYISQTIGSFTPPSGMNQTGMTSIVQNGSAAEVGLSVAYQETSSTAWPGNAGTYGTASVSGGMTFAFKVSASGGGNAQEITLMTTETAVAVAD